MSFFSNIYEVLNRIIKIEKKISQVELAKKMNVSPVSVNKWLNGGSIELSKIPNLCMALNITPNELFGFDISVENDEMKKLYDAYIKHPEHKESINKLLEIKTLK